MNNNQFQSLIILKIKQFTVIMKLNNLTNLNCSSFLVPLKIIEDNKNHF